MPHHWERLAQLDPLFVTLAEPDKKGGGWDPHAFLQTGRDQIADTFARLDTLGVELPGNRAALDFGCGPGRLTQALAERFDAAHGVDVAPSMLRIANELNEQGEKCRFHLNERPDLALFEDASFDFVYTSKVLFHIPPKRQVGFIHEFLRVLRPGGVAAFELSVFSPQPTRRMRFYQRYRNVRRRLINRQNQYFMMRALGFRPQWLYRTFGLRPMMRMYTVDESRIRRELAACGAEFLALDEEPRGLRTNATWIVRRPGSAPA